MRALPSYKFFLATALESRQNVCMKTFPAVWLPVLFAISLQAAPMDVAPFGLPLPEGNGVLWEDPRELHRVIVHFETPPVAPEKIRLEYWGSRWPDQRLPKDREPGGGDVGWMELGNWYQGGWRVADTKSKTDGNALTFLFHPVNAKEFPDKKTYPAEFRYTLKIRAASDAALPKIQKIEAFTDSVWTEFTARINFAKSPRTLPEVKAFNGAVDPVTQAGIGGFLINARIAQNSDPNTFDRTLITVVGDKTFTFAADDLRKGALFLPEFGVAITTNGDPRKYAAVAAEQKSHHEKTLYDRVAEMPEQNWKSAWSGMPPKKSFIYFPLGLDGGRQRFLLKADGSFQFRHNDHFLIDRPGNDTPRLALEPASGRFEFDLPTRPVSRELQESTLPVCHATWEHGGVRIEQIGFVTELSGTKESGPTPPADALTVCCIRFRFQNVTNEPRKFTLPVRMKFGRELAQLRIDDAGTLWQGTNFRGLIQTDAKPTNENGVLKFSWTLPPDQTREIVLKIPYVILTNATEQTALANLDFSREQSAVRNYWRRRLDESTRLITPEPVLNDFYRSVTEHLLVNCEREPNSERRFARVGSFSYGAYGNESCMMVVDLDRRGLHKEAEECLDAWLHYQGSVGLPGDFSSQKGILYGAGGYEMGGYNQHHGWILWMMAEHFRFTRDENWLRKSAAGILAGADWIIRETKRTSDRHELERGLLPAGSLEDIGDWWTWLSTSCYSWRGLDSAAWALEQIHHPDAKRIRAEAEAFHTALLKNFRAASERSPVVRLRDGTAVPKIPSYVHRRGRSFGWICETLEGSIHLLITGALDPHSPEAEWIIKDYEDNLYLSNQYGYLLDDFEKNWFSRGGMSMQACLLFNVEPYLYRDDVKHALRAIFNAIAVSHFPDVHMNTEHALPQMGDWRGDHFKSSDEANACGWLRQMFIREDGDELVVGQAVPRDWLEPGRVCGMEYAATHFGKVSVIYTAGEKGITAEIEGLKRNPPKSIRLRFRTPGGKPIESVLVNGERWKNVSGEWVQLPGNIGAVVVSARFKK